MSINVFTVFLVLFFTNFQQDCGKSSRVSTSITIFPIPCNILLRFHAESNKKDPFRALVRWYSRVGQLPTRIRKWETQLDQALDVNWEVVDEGARYKGDISIETIFGMCSSFCMGTSVD